jgi:hypothetical protein
MTLPTTGPAIDTTSIPHGAQVAFTLITGVPALVLLGIALVAVWLLALLVAQPAGSRG